MIDSIAPQSTNVPREQSSKILLRFPVPCRAYLRSTPFLWSGVVISLCSTGDQSVGQMRTRFGK